MAKRYAGNEPERGTVIAETRSWWLFRLPGNGGKWLRLKLVSKVLRKRANYALAWSESEARLAAGKDAAALNDALPEMFDWVVEQMMDVCGE